MKISSYSRHVAATTLCVLASGSTLCVAQPAAPKSFEQDLTTELAAAHISAAIGLAGVPELTRSFVANDVGGRLVKGAPYSATAVSEAVQALADGNRIVRKSETRLARDGEGRTRQERADGSVFISDPVSGKTWLLRPKSKSAIELSRAMHFAHTPGAAPLAPRPPVPPVPPGAPAAAPAPPAPAVPGTHASQEEMRSWAESMRAWARDFAARFRNEDVHVHREVSKDGARIESRVVTVRGPRVDVHSDAGSDGTFTREIKVVSSGDGAVPMAWAHSGGAFAFGAGPGAPFPTMAPLGQGATTSLGSREFDGVRADGSRTTWTIPAGKIGNEKPIEIFSERWHAPDLMLVVQTRHVDPRTGENAYRLSQLKRGEPDAALFKVPADYEVRSRADDRKREREKN